MTAHKLTFTQVFELLLARLYDVQTRRSAETYFNLNALASQLNQPVPADWAMDAGKIMEAQRLARCGFLVGICYAKLAGGGRAYVENKKGSGIVQEYFQNPDEFFQPGSIDLIASAGADLAEIAGATDLTSARQPTIQLVEQIRSALQSDASLDERRKHEFLDDLDAIQKQLARSEPNRYALAALLAPLGRIPSVIDPVRSLIDVINA